ncbi:hypothetical protein GOD03_12285 [Sinorhizobium medicae]|nr:hypothetical protein [Sinorhizobium medicae]
MVHFYTPHDVDIMCLALARWCSKRSITTESEDGQFAAVQIVSLMATERYTPDQLMEKLEALWAVKS